MFIRRKLYYLLLSVIDCTILVPTFCMFVSSRMLCWIKMLSFHYAKHLGEN